MTRLWAIIASVLLAAQVSAQEPGEEPIVIVLSWDGLRHDYPDRGDFPGLARMEAEGIRGRLIPVYPSNTFPTHVSMATGTHPDVHGIIDNVFWDPARRQEYRYSADTSWLEAEPIWIASERQGVPTATYFWVGSEQDWRGMRQRYRMAPFDGSRPESEKVDQMARWLDMPTGERPRLMLCYWAGADSVGHEHGPNADAITAQVKRQDIQLQRLLEAIDERKLWPVTTLMIVSDHGMSVVANHIDLEDALADAGIKATVRGGAVAHVFLEDAGQADVAEAILNGLDHVEAYQRGNVPASFRLAPIERTGDLVAVTTPPHVFRAPPGGWLGKVAALFGEYGGHGYHPSNPAMHAAFYALGRGVRQVGNTTFHQIDVAATIARLLDIEPPEHSEGAPMGWLILQ